MRLLSTIALSLSIACALGGCKKAETAAAETTAAPDAQTGTVERTGPDEQTGTVERTGPDEQTGTVERTGPDEQTGTVERTTPPEQ